MRNTILLGISKNIVLEKNHKHKFRANITFCWKVLFPLIVGVGLYRANSIPLDEAMDDLGINTKEEYDNRLKDWFDLLAYARTKTSKTIVDSTARTIRICGQLHTFDAFEDWIRNNIPNSTWKYHTKTINGERKIDWLALARDEELTTLMLICKQSWRKVDGYREDKFINLIRKIAMIQTWVRIHKKDKFVNNN